MLRGLGEERAPKKDSGPEVQRHDAKRFGQRECELGQREGVGEGEGEESEGQEVVFHWFISGLIVWVRLDLVQCWRKVGGVATTKKRKVCASG